MMEQINHRSKGKFPNRCQKALFRAEARLDKGYDFEDVHQFVRQQSYIPHIKHRRLRDEPNVEECPIPGETQFPPRRWVVQ